MKRIRKAVSLTIVVALMLMLYGGRETAQMAEKNGKAEVKVSSVKITNTGKRLRLQKGKTFRLKTRVKVKPDSSKYKKLKFTSSDRKTVRVNSRGILRGVQVGKAKVTAASKTNPKKKTSIPVSVTRDVLVTGILLNKTKITVDEFNEAEIRLSVRKILPSNARNKKVEWFTSNADIADVDEDGRMMTGNAGTATVTARAADGGGACATCRVTVKESGEQGDDAGVTGRPVRVTQNPLGVTQNPAGVTQNPLGVTQNPPGVTQNPAMTPTERPAVVTGQPIMSPEATRKPTMSPGYAPDSVKLDMEAACLATSQIGMESMPDGAKKLLYTGEYQGVFFDMSSIDFTKYEAIKVTANVPAQISFTFYNKNLDTNEEDWWVTYKILDFYPFWGGSFEDGRGTGGKGEKPGIETHVYDFSHIPDEKLAEIVYLSIGSHEFQEGDYIIYSIEFVEKGQTEPSVTFPGYKNPDEAAALKQMIAEQRAFGATVSEDLDSDEYKWNGSGNLTGINWGGIWDEENSIYAGKKLSGEISFSAFPKLAYLDCSHSWLSSLDVKENLELKELHCQNNQLNTLNTGENPALMILDCYSASLSILDLRGNPGLEQLRCQENQLGILDISGNPVLKVLICDRNQLKDLDVSGNPDLKELHCKWNKLVNVDVSKNPLLESLNCYDNWLGDLDVSGNPELKSLDCGDNQLSSLDTSRNPDLEELACQNNQIRSLDINKNPDLRILWCGNNQLSSLDVGGNPELTLLNCYLNQLSSLDVSGNPGLVSLDCENNQLSSLDVSRNPELKSLNCRDNQLGSLDVSGNSKLENLLCSSNRLSSLDVSRNLALTELICDEEVTVTGYRQ